jgi:hypothetical protein
MYIEPIYICISAFITEYDSVLWSFEICFHRLFTVIEKSKIMVFNKVQHTCLARNRRGPNVFRCRHVPFHTQVLEFLVLGPPDTQDRSNFPLKIGFPYAQVAFETDFGAGSFRLVYSPKVLKEIHFSTLKQEAACLVEKLVKEFITSVFITGTKLRMEVAQKRETACYVEYRILCIM